MKKDGPESWTLLGWWLFVICAGCFIIASINSRDPFSLLGSVFFMAGNVAFLFPYYHKGRERRGRDDE